MSTKRNKLFFLLKSTIQLLGLVFVLMFFLACTDIPYNALMRLAEVPSCERPPRYIFVQGGNAFPSADALLLQYHLEKSREQFPEAKIYYCLPSVSSDTSGESYIRARLVSIADTCPLQLKVISDGVNTHDEIQKLVSLLPHDSLHCSLLLITKPEHYKRSIACLNRSGITDICGINTMDTPVPPSLLAHGEESKRSPALLWRYNVWSYLQYEIIIFREYCAILYYRLKSYI